MDERSLPLLLALMLLYSRPSAGDSVGESAAQMAWNLIGAISRIRHGPDDDDARDPRQSGSSLLSDPHFLFGTFYRFQEVSITFQFKQ